MHLLPGATKLMYHVTEMTQSVDPMAVDDDVSSRTDVVADMLRHFVATLSGRLQSNREQAERVSPTAAHSRHFVSAIVY